MIPVPNIFLSRPNVVHLVSKEVHFPNCSIKLYNRRLPFKFKKRKSFTFPSFQLFCTEKRRTSMAQQFPRRKSKKLTIFSLSPLFGFLLFISKEKGVLSLKVLKRIILLQKIGKILNSAKGRNLLLNIGINFPQMIFVIKILLDDPC